jgi:hypothetical protein
MSPRAEVPRLIKLPVPAAEAFAAPITPAACDAAPLVVRLFWFITEFCMVFAEFTPRLLDVFACPAAEF